MTKQKAIDKLKDLASFGFVHKDLKEALQMAIEALEEKQQCSIDFARIEEKLEKAFEAETPVSFKKWITELRAKQREQ